MSEGNFWLSDEGILIRLEDLAHSFTYKSYNGAIKGAFREAGITEFEWVTTIDDRTCNRCDSLSGRRYKSGQFMPRMPAHIGCRCFWDAYIEL